MINLLSPIHHFCGRFNSLDFICGVFRVNVLPVLTVCDPVTPALPVSSDPGEKHRRIHDISLSLTCTSESGQRGRIQKHIQPDILRFYENLFSMHWFAVHISSHPKAKAIMLSVLAANGKTMVSIAVVRIHSVNIITELMKHEMDCCFLLKGTVQLHSVINVSLILLSS